MNSSHTAPVEQVTTEQALSWMETALRNFPLGLRFGQYELEDVRAELQRFRLAATAPMQARIERLEAINAELLAFVEAEAKMDPVFAKGHQKKVIAGARVLVERAKALEGEAGNGAS